MTTDLRRLGRMVKQAQWRDHRAVDAALHGVGTTLAQWDALRAIATRPGASAHALALVTFQSDQAFGTLTTRMAARGLVERHPGVGRRVRYELTAEGERLLAAGQEAADRTLATLFAPLDEADRAALTSILGRLLGEDDDGGSADGDGGADGGARVGSDTPEDDR
ncbi:MarR family transcriptional regulator [Curtobacterium sp. MCBD17_040]|uniref:MarR family winged helix-turn-helix transcriptional regulator n=1 Tax=Curtobacterium sp. MCBD17_040 TaxID=2175674 RepID=UPI000DAA3E61|nr:MarR family transcriptional regulator [Curtobacterium sp. MCBD17_040]WIB62938.1 MarR family transcriptional regulator [Curtobacterium sp. MCBD17_040]